MLRVSAKPGFLGLVLVLAGCAGSGPVVERTATDEAVFADPQVLEAYAQALQAMDAGDTRTATVRFEQLSQIHPELAGPYLNLGLMHAREGDTERALLAFQKAAKASPRSAVAHNQMGIIYRQQGQFDAAEQAYLAAVKADPAYAKAWYNLALLWDLYRGDATRALEYAQRYQALAPAEEERDVQRWIADLSRRSAVQVAARKEEGI